MNFKKDNDKFEFKCSQCGECCKNLKIRLSPYDILILCKKLNLTTTEFLRKHSYFIFDSENQGLLTCMLKTFPECLFLKDKSCTVYASRPLGCRTFPLGTQPFYDGKTFINHFYVLEKCGGFKTNNSILVGKFKQEQNIYSDEIIAPWVKFKVDVINSNLLNTPDYHRKFVSICYDFDSVSFKNLLKQLNLAWPNTIEEQNKLIITLANRYLL